tara:strand:+ start:371 stop:538 length:168 start_codon:yes stop_codon:yes gene_type:complete
MTDLEKLKQCLDDIGVDYIQYDHAGGTTIEVDHNRHLSDAQVVFVTFNKDGSIQR